MRGQIADTLFLPLLLFGIIVTFAIVGLIAYKVIPPILSGTNQTNTKIGENVQKIPNSINYIAWGFLIGSIILFIMSAMYIHSNPIFFGVAVFVLAFAIYFAMGFSNILETFKGSNADVNSTMNSMSSLIFLQQHFVEVVAGVGLISLVLTYIFWKLKPEEGGGVGGV